MKGPVHTLSIDDVVNDLDFDFGDFGASHGCGLTWQNKHFIFGGDQHLRREISQVSGCTLERVGKLRPGLTGHACTNMNGRIFLCFPMLMEAKWQSCYVSETGPMGEFNEIARTRYPHTCTRIASSQREFLLELQFIVSMIKTSLYFDFTIQMTCSLLAISHCKADV